jgi:pimeloyl-ACP methyl ester carboxylesterase
MTTTRARDGTNISYRVEGTGPLTLVFVHGWAGSSGYFGPTLRFLDLARTRVVRVEMRGHGGSEPGRAEGLGLEQAAEDILQVAHAVGARQFVLLGFSLGAKVAQYVAVRAPQRVAGLVLVAGCPVTEIPLPREMLDDWYARVGNGPALAAITERYASRPISSEILESIARDAEGIPAPALSGLLEECLRVSFAESMHAAQMPSLVVGGVQDQIFGPDMLRLTVVDGLPHARLALLDCGHEIPVELPRELAAIIEAFLAGLPVATSVE